MLTVFAQLHYVLGHPGQPRGGVLARCVMQLGNYGCEAHRNPPPVSYRISGMSQSRLDARMAPEGLPQDPPRNTNAPPKAGPSGSVLGDDA